MRLPAVKSVIIVTGFIRRMEKIRLDGETMTRGQFVYRYAYCDESYHGLHVVYVLRESYETQIDRLLHVSPPMVDYSL